MKIFNKSYFNNEVFQRYVVVSGKIGAVGAVYDENFRLI